MVMHRCTLPLFAPLRVLGGAVVALLLAFSAGAEELSASLVDPSLVIQEVAFITPVSVGAVEHAPAIPDTAPPAAARDSSQRKQEVALNSLRPERGPIRLMGMQNNAQVSFPVPARQQLSDIELALFVTNSIALGSRSHMAVAVNGVVIGQLPFRAQYPETRARISIPAELIEPGYNQITFSVAQLPNESCEDQSAPDLWSEIDTSRSKISYSVKAQAIKPSLAELPQLIDKRLLGGYRLTIATTAEPGASVIEAGGLVAQAAALSRDYAPLAISHALLPAAARGAAARDPLAALPGDLFNGGDGVLLGRRDLLKPWLDEESYQLAAEPLLALFPFGPKEERFVLVVTGADDAQVRQAAQALVNAYFTLPPVAKANIGAMAVTPVNQRPTLLPGVPHPFTDFNFRTATRKGIYPEGMAMRFWVPADHFAYPNSKLSLSLHLAYGAGFGPQSVLNIFLNNHFEHAVRLAESPGAVYYDYQVAIPVRSLVPGWNELQFRPSLIPLRAEGRCQPIYTENLLLTLFDDSTMVAGEMQQLTELPDLALLGRTAYPFGGGRSTTPARLALTGLESGILEAAWTLQGKLAQVNHAPIIGMRTVVPEQADGNTLLVGRLDQVPKSLLTRSHLHHPGWWQEGQSRRRASHTTAGDSFMEQLRDLLPADWQVGSAQAAPAEPSGMPSKVALGNLLDHSLVVTQFESPRRRGESVLLVAANTPELLSRQVATLVNDAYWGQLLGATVVLGRDSETVRNYGTAQSYLVGSAGLKPRVAHLFGRNKALAMGVVAATIFLFALLTWRLLLAYRRRQHEGRAV